MEPLIIPIVAILMPLVLVPTILVLKHRHKRREWEHRERIKAMELQMPVPRGFGRRELERRGGDRGRRPDRVCVRGVLDGRRRGSEHSGRRSDLAGRGLGLCLA